MPTVEERLERIERILEDSGLAFLADVRVGPTLLENLSLLMEPKNLRLVSHLANLVEVLAQIDPNALGMFVEAAGEAVRETFTDEVLRQPPRVSAAGLLRQLSDPEVQQALGLLFLLLRLLPRTLARLQREREQLESLMEQMKK